MKRPTWATVVGILGIILGCFGILGAGQTMMMPKIMELQKEMFTVMEKEFESQEGPPEEFFNMFNKMWDVPDWFNTWSIISGIIALFVSGFHVFASICLLQIKRSSIKLFYLAVGMSIGFALLRGVIAISTMSFMGFSMMAGGLFGLVINVILLVVVATGDKQAFTSMESLSKQTA